VSIFDNPFQLFDPLQENALPIALLLRVSLTVFPIIPPHKHVLAVILLSVKHAAGIRKQ